MVRIKGPLLMCAERSRRGWHPAAATLPWNLESGEPCRFAGVRAQIATENR